MKPALSNWGAAFKTVAPLWVLMNTGFCQGLSQAGRTQRDSETREPSEKVKKAFPSLLNHLDLPYPGAGAGWRTGGAFQRHQPGAEVGSPWSNLPSQQKPGILRAWPFNRAQVSQGRCAVRVAPGRLSFGFLPSLYWLFRWQPAHRDRRNRAGKGQKDTGWGFAEVGGLQCRPGMSVHGGKT